MQIRFVRRALRGTTTALLGACLALFASGASAEAGSWGPEVGSALPAIEAPDETGTLRTLEDLSGANGLLFLFSRSVDW